MDKLQVSSLSILPITVTTAPGNTSVVSGARLIGDKILGADGKLIDNPNWAYDLGQRLYETVKDTYDLNKVTKDRAELYKSLIK